MPFTVYWLVSGARRRAVARVATAFAVLLVTSFPALPAGAAVSPLGDVAAAWPSAWTTYVTSGGTAVVDPTGDEHPGTVDLASGTGTSPTMYYALDGTNLFVRLRVAADPSNAAKGGLDSEAFVVRLVSGGTVLALTGVNGKSPSTDYVFVAAGDGSGVTPVYEHPFTTTSAGLRVLPDGDGQFFLDFQVPLARVVTASGGALTAATPVELVAGTTSSANLTNLNKDVVSGAPVTLPVTPPVEPVVEPVVVEPVEPVVTDPVVTDPVVPDPVITDPVVTDPVVPDPDVTDPVITDPVVTEPVVEPVVIDPVVTDPVVTDPVVEPVVTDPVVTEPVVTDPVVEPVVTDPVVTEPVLPGPVVPEPVLPGPVLPETPATAPRTVPPTGQQVRPRLVVRPSVARDVPELPRTGLPIDVALATGVALVLAGALATSRGQRETRPCS